MSVRYWFDHCVHSRPFDGLAKALDFLAAGWRRHEFFPDAIVAAWGRALATPDEVLHLLAKAAGPREIALQSILDKSAKPQPAHSGH